MTTTRRLLLLAPAAILLATAVLPVGWRSPVPLCLASALTGLSCPGCGMTRAFLLIGHGRLADATAAHPASVPAFLVVGGMAIAGVIRAFGLRPASTRNPSRPFPEHR